MHRLAHTYEVAKRDVLVRTDDVRVQTMTLTSGQSVPWHKHTVVDDTFVCLEGELLVRTDDGERETVLTPGGLLTVRAGTGHAVEPLTDRGAVFLLIQGTGAHDFLPMPDPMSSD